MTKPSPEMIERARKACFHLMGSEFLPYRGDDLAQRVASFAQSEIARSRAHEREPSVGSAGSDKKPATDARCFAPGVQSGEPGPVVSAPDSCRDARVRQETMEEIDLEKFCITFGWFYGTAIEKHYNGGREPSDGMTAEQIWEQSAEEDREFVRSVFRDTFAAIRAAAKQEK